MNKLTFTVQSFLFSDYVWPYIPVDGLTDTCPDSSGVSIDARNLAANQVHTKISYIYI